MSRPSRTLLGMITDKALRTFPEDLLAGADGDSNQLVNTNWEENFPLWTEHYLKTAEKIYQDFVDEGLLETAAAIRKLIDWQKGMIS